MELLAPAAQRRGEMGPTAAGEWVSTDISMDVVLIITIVSHYSELASVSWGDRAAVQRLCGHAFMGVEHGCTLIIRPRTTALCETTAN
ncbi:unnamed protein product [Arctogadus glacialis]